MSELSRRYATALYESGVSEASFSAAAHMLQDNAPLWDAFLSPVVRKPEKQGILQGLSMHIADDKLLTFFCLLAEKGRMDILPNILQDFHLLGLEKQQGAECLVTCVHIPTEQQQAAICRMLCKAHHKDFVSLQFQIDPALLGGFVLELEGITYDQSIRGRLLGLSRYLEEVKLT